MLIPVPEPLAAFDTLEAFYDDRRVRRWSGETDFGVWWTMPGYTWPRWRVSWVEDTGELYAVKLCGSADLDVRVEAVVETRQQVEALLDGWVDYITGRGSLAWLWGRVATLRGAGS